MVNEKKYVSIIISVKNAQGFIGKCLDSLKALSYPAYEIIVIDDSSTDATVDIVRKYKGVIFIITKGVGPSKARNLGIEKAKGAFVAFTDSDCIVHPDWLKELLKGFNSELVVSVGGDQQSPEDETEFGRSVQDFLKTIGFVADYVKNSKKGIAATKHNPTCNVMYKASVLKDSGGFLEGLWPGEDLELDYRLGKKGFVFLYNPNAVVYHYRPQNYSRFAKMMFSYGRVQAVLIRMHGPFRVVHFEPLLILLIIGVFFYIPGLSLAIALAAVFLLFIYAFFKRKFMKDTVPFFLLFIITGICWNAGFIKGIFITK